MDTGQLLTGVFLSNRDDQSPTYRQLLFESFRNSRSACCNTDAIERGRFRPPQRTVSTAQIHLAEPGAVKIQPGLLYQLRNPLDRKYLQCHAGQHRSEEHTSELQSREQIVCRLLLEKTNP